MGKFGHHSAIILFYSNREAIFNHLKGVKKNNWAIRQNDDNVKNVMSSW